MATYVMLVNFTEQGIRSVKENTKRAEGIKDMAKKLGVEIKTVLSTLGQYDIVAIAEAPDAAAVTALSLGAAAAGNVRTQTLAAFTADEMGRILSKVA
jgi:uncharacterized protein with GYD domain